VQIIKYVLNCKSIIYIVIFLINRFIKDSFLLKNPKANGKTGGGKQKSDEGIR
jgi:hypothetical protein